MVELFCALMGVADSVFSADVDASASIARVKEAILTKKESRLRGAQCCDADELQLFFAVAKMVESGNNNRTWLASRNPNVTALKKGMEIPRAIAELIGEEDDALDETATLAESIEEAHLSAPSSRQLHVLVVLSKKQQQLVDDEDGVNQYGEGELSTSSYCNSCTSVSSDEEEDDNSEENWSQPAAAAPPKAPAAPITPATAAPSRGI